jgi:hypothetical protein
VDKLAFAKVGERYVMTNYTWSGTMIAKRHWVASHDKRLRTLREVRARLKGPESLFLFSSHSLHSYPFAFRWTVDPRRQIRTLYQLTKDAAFNLRLTLSNLSVSSDEVKRRGWAVLNDGAHGFRLSTYSVSPRSRSAR